MSKPNEEDRVQKIAPFTPRNQLTSDAPCPPVRSRRWFPWLIAGPILFGVLAIAALITAYQTDFLKYGLYGYPKTPMTVAKAEQIASAGPSSGSGLEEVEAWLPSQGIISNPKTQGPYYGVYRKRENEAFPNTWMDGVGNQTVAECAGLKTADVPTFIRVTYPDADRYLLGFDEIIIYFFFDAKDRLIKHWVDVRHIMP